MADRTVMVGTQYLHQPLQLFGKLTTKAQFENVVAAHDYGYFQVSAYLMRQMIRCGRVAQCIQTRSTALTGTPIENGVAVYDQVAWNAAADDF